MTSNIDTGTEMNSANSEGADILPRLDQIIEQARRQLAKLPPAEFAEGIADDIADQLRPLDPHNRLVVLFHLHHCIKDWDPIRDSWRDPKPRRRGSRRQPKER